MINLFHNPARHLQHETAPPDRRAETQQAASVELWARLSFTKRVHANAEHTGVTAESFTTAWRRTGNAISVELILSSMGGDCASMFAILALMANDRRLKRAVGLHQVESAASCVYLACDERWIHPDAVLMIHDPHVAGTKGRTPQERADVATYRERILNHYCARLPHLPRAQIDAWMTNETYFDANDAIRYGLAHRIVNPNEWVVDGKPISLAGLNRPWHAQQVSAPVTAPAKAPAPVAPEEKEPTWKEILARRPRPKVERVPVLLIGTDFTLSSLRQLRSRWSGYTLAGFRNYTPEDRAGRLELVDDAIRHLTKN